MLDGVDGEARRLEGFAAVGRADDDDHRCLAELDPSDSVQQYDPSGVGPLGAHVARDRRKLRLDLFLVGLVVEVGHTRASFGVVAHRAEEGDDGAAVGAVRPREGGLDGQGLGTQADPVVALVAHGYRAHASMVRRHAVQPWGDAVLAYPLGKLDPMELDDEDDHVSSSWLPPDDRLWRHPSEVGFLRGAREAAVRARPTPWSVGILSGTIGALLVAGVMVAAGAMNPAGVQVIERVASPQQAKAGQGSGIPDIAERVRPAIVQVQAVGPAGRSGASGVLFRSDGHILTNNHVVEGASEIRVLLASGAQRSGTLVGGDPDTDIAVVKIDGKDLPTVVLGSAEKLRVGEVAIAIGSPLGLAGGPSVSVGVVSALARQVDGEGDRPLLDMIQTDAPIAPGSSGGALLDSSGSVIGITTAIAVDTRTGAEGLGFATPIDIARDVAEQLITTGRVVHVWLGIEGEDVDDAMAGELGVENGALVKRVREGSPADAAGIEPGDVIANVEGRRVSSMASLLVTLRSRRPGDVVELKVLREGKWAQMKATLAPRPAR